MTTGAGFTLTRADGWFDILLNGGGIITLKFGKSPFIYQSKSVFVPWNQVRARQPIFRVSTIAFQIIIMDEVRLSKDIKKTSLIFGAFCSDHNSKVTRPIIKSHGKLSVSPSNKQSDSLREMVSLEPFRMNMVYQSRRSQGYSPVIQMELVQERPETLETVHTKISIEGRVFMQIYEAENNLTQLFVFDGHDTFGQKVYGKSLVKVEVGYQYKLCSKTVWETRMVELQTGVPHTSNIGGWDLDIHHRYNPGHATVYKGDGSVIDLKEKEQIVVALNENFTKTIIGPTAVEVDREGIMYIGDSSHVMTIDSFGRVTYLLKLNESTSTAMYYLALSATNTHIYLSDPTQKRILKIPVDMPQYKTVHNNFDVFVGSGETCTMMDKDSCGEGQAASTAKLVYPKGLAITQEDELIFVDGNRVRMVNKEGKVITIAGSRKMASEWRPAKCGSDLRLEEANFNWPTDIAVNPVTNDIVLIDQGAVHQISQQGRITELINSNCHPEGYENMAVPTNVAFTSDGTLHVSDDKQMIHRMEEDGGIREVAGSMSYCRRAVTGCLQSDFEERLTLASKARFQRISDITVGPDGSIFVADLEKHHIRSIRHILPEFVEREMGAHRESYEIMSPDTREMYVFDRLGVHLETKGLFAGAVGHNFLYKSGNLWMVHDKDMNNIEMKRSGGEVTSIELSNGLSFKVRVNKNSDLQEVRAPNGFVTMFQYKENTGLLKRVFLDRGKMQYIYDYSPEGHLMFGLSPVTRLHETERAAEPVIERCDISKENALLLEIYEGESKINPVIVGFSLKDQGEQIHNVKWEYFVHSQGRSSFGVNVDGIGKRFLVNDVMAFKSELHPRSMIQSLYDSEGAMLVKVEKYAVPKRTLIIPRAPFHPVDQTYNEQRRPKSWSWGTLSLTLDYDNEGRILDQTDCMGQKKSFQYAYEDDTYPNIWINEDGSRFQVGLDNSGGVERITTPMGEVHTFSARADLGSYVLEYHPPWSKRPITFSVSDDGYVLEKQVRGTPGKILYQSKANVSSLKSSELIMVEKVEGRTIYQTADTYKSSVKLRNNISYDTSAMHFTQEIYRGSKILSKTVYQCQQSIIGYSVNCNFTVNEKLDKMRRTFHKTNNKVSSFRGFDLVRSLQSSVYIHKQKQAEFKQDFNGYGLPTKTVIKIKGKVVYSSATEHLCNQKIKKISAKVLERNPRISTFSYAPKGGLSLAETPTFTWKYQHDNNGNIVNADFGIGNTSFVYQFNERISRAGFNQVNYTAGGNVAERSGYKFDYNSQEQLIQVSYGDQLRKEVVYDLKARPVLLVDHARNESTTLVYALESKPWLLTHCQMSRTDKLYRFTYDTKGHVISMEDGRNFYMIATSPTGTPEIVFDARGELVKEVHMSPFGTVFQDTNEDLPTCLGFHGGVDLQETGIVIIQGRPYDSILGSWMVPDTDRMIQLPSHPADVFVYMFKKNDPVNIQNKDDVESLEGWLDFFGLNMETLSNPIMNPRKLGAQLQPKVSLKMTQHQETEDDLAALLDPSVQRSLSFEKESRHPQLGRYFHIKAPMLGPNIILTTKKGQDVPNAVILAYTIEEASPIEKTIAGVLNNTIHLENYKEDQESIFFLKEEGILEEDIVSLKTRMKVEEREIPPHGREVCIRTQRTR